MKDQDDIDKLVKTFFLIFNNTHQKQPDWDKLQTICLDKVQIIKKNESGMEFYDLNTFIEPRKKLLAGGTLTEFQEGEIEGETKINGNIAQRSSSYQKSGYLNGNHFHERGHKFFQFVKTGEGWKINSLIWEDANN